MPPVLLLRLAASSRVRAAVLNACGQWWGVVGLQLPSWAANTTLRAQRRSTRQIGKWPEQPSKGYGALHGPLLLNVNELWVCLLAAQLPTPTPCTTA